MQSASISDIMLIHEIIDSVEQDSNLSMLPDPLKKIAIETIFEERKAAELNVNAPNKRSRTMEEEESSLQGALMNE